MWPLQLLPSTLRRLVLLCPVPYKKLPLLFQLPHLDELVLSRIVSPASKDEFADFGLPPRRSTVTSLSITAYLDEAHIIQLLLQPKRLNHFILITQGLRTEDWIPPRPRALEQALAPFRHSLRGLELDIDDIKFAVWPPATGIDQMKLQLNADLRPFESLRTFENLTGLRIPSMSLFGMPGENYSRKSFCQTRPSSIKSLEVDFGIHDPFHQCVARTFCQKRAITQGWKSTDPRNIDWMIQFARDAYLYLPHLREVTFSDRSVRVPANTPFSGLGHIRMANSLTGLKQRIAPRA